MSKEMSDNPFLHTNTNKRYYTLDYHFKKHFGCKVFKVSLNAGFTCPNRDGSKGVGGCTFCSSQGSGDFAGNIHKSIDEQFSDIKSAMHKKWDTDKYIAYFQAYTNTYAPTEVLENLYEQALSQKGVVGLFISTRPDCVSESCLKLLCELSKRTYLVVELGLQSIHDTTAHRINRGHTYDVFLQTYTKLHEHGINVCVHIINGLPHEDTQMMMQTIKEVSRLKPHSVKIHMLHIIKGSVMAKEYERGEFELLSKEDYVNLVVNQLEILPPDTIIQRLTGDGVKEDLIAPLWSLKKFTVLNDIDKLFLQRNSCQGKLYTKEA